MSDPRLEPEAIKAACERSKTLRGEEWATCNQQEHSIALDIVKAIAEAPEPVHQDDCPVPILNHPRAVCSCHHRWWKAARALVGGKGDE